MKPKRKDLMEQLARTQEALDDARKRNAELNRNLVDTAAIAQTYKDERDALQNTSDGERKRNAALLQEATHLTQLASARLDTIAKLQAQLRDARNAVKQEIINALNSRDVPTERREDRGN